MNTTITPAHAPTLSESASGVLRLLLGAGPGALHLDARTDGGIGHQTFHISRVESGWLPEALLTLLEARHDWHVCISPAVREASGSRLLRLHALFARWTITPAFSLETQWEHRIPPEAVADVAHRIDGFPLGPSAVIDGARAIIALWRLATPIDLRSEAGEASALAIQARLAGVLGASTAPIPHCTPMTSGQSIRDEIAAHDPAGFIPLVGHVREMGTNAAPHVVTIPRLDVDRVYTIEQIEAAIEGSTTATTSASPRTRRSHRQEQTT